MKKAVLIIGDGFSTSFRKHLGVLDKTYTGQLIPPPQHIEFVPRNDDDPPKGPLFTEELYPELWRFWHKHLKKEKETGGETGSYSSFLEELSKMGAPAFKDKKGVEKLYEKFSKEALDKVYPDGLAPTTIYTSGANVELRSYLWHLFTEYDKIITEAMIAIFGSPEDPVKISRFYQSWEYGYFLQRINNEFDCSYVSYNYDLVLERALSALGKTIYYPMESKSDQSKISKHGSLVIKPHGSINFHTQFMGLENMPLDTFAFMVGVGGNITRAVADYQERRPIVFDIVPPGHPDKNAIANPFFDIFKMAQSKVEDADVVILCGLSASEPDTAEINDLLKVCKKEVRAIHLGLPQDEQNDAGRLLKKYCASYQHISMQDLKSKEGLHQLWQLNWQRDLNQPAKETNPPNNESMTNRLIVDSFQTMGLTNATPEGVHKPASTLLVYMKSSIENIVNGCRFVWELFPEDPKNRTLISASWMDLNFDFQQDRYDFKPNYLYIFPLLVCNMPFGPDDNVFFMQNEKFSNTLAGSRVVIYPQIKYIRANLVLLNAKDFKIGAVNFEILINKEEEEIIYKYWEKEETPVSTIIWRPNSKPQ